MNWFLSGPICILSTALWQFLFRSQIALARRTLTHTYIYCNICTHLLRAGKSIKTWVIPSIIGQGDFLHVAVRSNWSHGQIVFLWPFDETDISDQEQQKRTTKKHSREWGLRVERAREPGRACSNLMESIHFSKMQGQIAWNHLSQRI